MRFGGPRRGSPGWWRRRGALGRLRGHLRALAKLVSDAGQPFFDRDGSAARRSDARALGAAHQALFATVQPRRFFRGSRPASTVPTLRHGRHERRRPRPTSQRGGPVPPRSRARVVAARRLPGGAGDARHPVPVRHLQPRHRKRSDGALRLVRRVRHARAGELRRVAPGEACRLYRSGRGRQPAHRHRHCGQREHLCRRDRGVRRRVLRAVLRHHRPECRFRRNGGAPGLRPSPSPRRRCSRPCPGASRGGCSPRRRARSPF
jgi:hypothetical protein